MNIVTQAATDVKCKNLQTLTKPSIPNCEGIINDPRTIANKTLFFPNRFFYLEFTAVIYNVFIPQN